MGKEELSGARALAECLLKMGTSRVYGIVGTSNVAFLDALFDLRDRIRYVSCRHEQVACSMADAEGRLTGSPGVVLVHSGPGALNSMISAGNAYKDCSPVIIITGAVKRRLAGSDGMLELDHGRLFAPLCKGAFRLDTASQVPSVFSAAYGRAMSEARGPVVIEVPEDVWVETGDIDLSALELRVKPAPAVDDGDVDRALEMLGGASLPLILSGGGVAYSGSSRLLAKVAGSLGVPVITTGNGRGTIPETSELCLGRVGFGGGSLVADRALERADALLCLGAGLSDMTTYEYTLPVGPDDIMMVNISEEIQPQSPAGRLARCDVADFLEAMDSRLTDENRGLSDSWRSELRQAHTAWERMRSACLEKGGDMPSPARIMKRLSDMLPDDTIVSVGAGMHLLYPMAFFPSLRPLTFLSTVNFGSMGFGMASTMAAGLVHPQRATLAVLGDGDFMMTVQDLETAVREDMPIKVLVLNDCQYRVLNVRQRLQYEGRLYGTQHTNPDFAELARAFGAAGYRVDTIDDEERVIERLVEERRPTVVDVKVDPDDLPPMNVEANLRMSASR